MGLYIADKSVSNLHVGSKSVSSAYLDKSKIYPVKKNTSYTINRVGNTINNAESEGWTMTNASISSMGLWGKGSFPVDCSTPKKITLTIDFYHTSGSWNGAVVCGLGQGEPNYYHMAFSGHNSGDYSGWGICPIGTNYASSKYMTHSAFSNGYYNAILTFDFENKVVSLSCSLGNKSVELSDSEISALRTYNNLLLVTDGEQYCQTLTLDIEY